VLGEVAAFGADLPFVVSLDQDRTGQPKKGGGVGEDARAPERSVGGAVTCGNVVA